VHKLGFDQKPRLRQKTKVQQSDEEKNLNLKKKIHYISSLLYASLSIPYTFEKAFIKKLARN
jgi:hypothetical protein